MNWYQYRIKKIISELESGVPIEKIAGNWNITVRHVRFILRRWQLHHYAGGR